MAYLNVKDRVIEAKIVYYGAGLSGKTTNLEKIKAQATDGRAGEMMTLETDGDRTLFFDWLPFHVGKFNGCDVKMQLYTVPGQAKYAETRRRVLASADGVVLVLDSQAAALPKNQACVRDLMEHLAVNGLASDVPIVVQLNKRDLPTAMPHDVLLRETGLTGRTFTEASAAKGAGVFETLREVTRAVLERVRTQASTRSEDLKTGDDSGLDGNTLYAQLTSDAVAAPPSSPPPSPPPASAAAKPRPAPPPPPPRSAPALPVTPPASPPSRISSSANAAATANASPAQLNELIAAHRTLARRLDQIEVNVARSVERALAELERRVLGRLAEIVDQTKLVRETASTEHATGHEGLVQIRASLGDLERKLKEDGAHRAEATKRAIDAATKPLVLAVESQVRSLEGMHAIDAAVRTTATALDDFSKHVVGRNHQVDAAIAGLHDRSHVMESGLRQVTELYAEMVTDAKKPKAWWR